MRSTHPLLILLFSVLSSAFVGGPNFYHKGLRSDTDVYNVQRTAEFFWVYSPYYKSNREAVTKLKFPPDQPDTIIVLGAYNDKERVNTDAPRKLLLSDIIPIVASPRHADRPLASVNWLVDQVVLEEPLVQILDKWFIDWMKKNPEATLPSQFTLTPSDPVWRKLEATTFFMAVSNTFREAEKIVTSIVIRPSKGLAFSRSKSLQTSDLWYHLEHQEEHK